MRQVHLYIQTKSLNSEIGVERLGGGGGGGGRLITGKIQHHLYSTDVCVHTETYFICLLLLV